MKTKLAFLAATIAATIAAPAFADNDETTAAKLDEVVVNTGSASTAKPALRLIADADDPVLTGGGSSGYNANLRQDT
jgi:hypothetical protein